MLAGEIGGLFEPLYHNLYTMSVHALVSYKAHYLIQQGSPNVWCRVEDKTKTTENLAEAISLPKPATDLASWYAGTGNWEANYSFDQGGNSCV